MCIRLCICVCMRSLFDFNNKIIITNISTPFHGRARERPALEYVAPCVGLRICGCLCAFLFDFNNKIIIKNGTHGGASREDTPKRAAVVCHQLKNMSPPLKRKLALESHHGTNTNTAAGCDISEGDAAGRTEFLEHLSVIFHLLVA